MFELIRAIKNTSILTEVDDNWDKHVTTRVWTRFFNIWTVWPIYWPKATHIQSWPTNHQIKLWDQFQGYFDQSVNKIFTILWSCDLVFHLQVQTHPSNYLHNLPGQVWWWLRQKMTTWVLTSFSHIMAVWPSFFTPGDPYSNLTYKSLKKKLSHLFPGYLDIKVATRVLTSFFYTFSSCDVVFHSRWLMFELIQAIT
jgi:hypothetical protein